MTFLSKYKTELATAAIVLVLCVFGFMAYNAWIAEPEVITKNGPEIERLQNELDQSKAATKQLEKAYRDSMAAHDKRYQAFINDTNGNKEITDQYNEVRTKHRSLEVDSAVGLMHARLSSESEYGTRFNYSNWPH